MERGMMGRKGLVFTVDGIIAMVLSAVIIIATLFYVQASDPRFTDVNLHRIALDSLTILEKDGTLKHAAETASSATLSEFLEAMPVQFCGMITIYDRYGSSITSVTRSGCLAKENKVISRRVFIAQDIRYAEMVMWYD